MELQFAAPTFRFVPYDVLSIIGEYLDFQSTDFFRFCNTCKHFQRLKYSSHVMYFSKRWSQLFYDRSTLLKLQLLSSHRAEDFYRIHHASLVKFSRFSLQIFRWIGVTDLSIYSTAYMVTIRDCHEITDVSALSGVKELTLWGCRAIQDVSSLGNLYKLNIMWCDGITDISALSRVPNLLVENCPYVEDTYRGIFA